jgi:hypothetical protein
VGLVQLVQRQNHPHQWTVDIKTEFSDVLEISFHSTELSKFPSVLTSLGASVLLIGFGLHILETFSQHNYAFFVRHFIYSVFL